MNTLDDFFALAQILPVNEGESGMAWVSRARGEGILDEKEWQNACQFVKQHLYLFKK